MKKLILALVTGFSITFSAITTTHSQDTDHLISRLAEKHGIPMQFAIAIVKVESNFNPRLRGSAGEYGLGQIKCGTARDVGFKGKCNQLYDPETNLEYSFRYMKVALDKADGNLCHAATLYNRGVGNRPKSSPYCKLVMNNL